MSQANNPQTVSHKIPLWRRFRWTLIFAFVIIAVLPIVIAVTIILQETINYGRLQLFSQLEAIAGLKTTQIDAWLDEGKTTLGVISANSLIREPIMALLSGEEEASETIVNTYLSEADTSTDVFQEVFVYGSSGEILASSDATQIGKFVNRQAFFPSSLENDINVQAPYYDIGRTELTLVVTKAIYNSTGEVIGLVAGRFNVTTLSEIMAVQTGLGETGETYIVSLESNYLLTPSRFPDFPLNRAYSSQGISGALGGENGSAVYENYRGERVLGVYRWLPELEVGLLAEIEEVEALQTSRQVVLIGIGVSTVAVIAALLIGLFNAERVSRPIDTLTKAVQNMLGGDLSQRVTILEKNELGQLGSAFNTMSSQLESTIQNLEVLNSELESRVAKRTRDLRVAADVSRQITTVLDREKLLPQLTEETRNAYNLYHASVFLYYENDTLLKLEAGTGEAGEAMRNERRSFRLDDAKGLVPKAARDRQPVIINDVSAAPEHLMNPLLPETRSEIALPMIIGDSLVGVLDLQAKEINRFQEEDIAILQSLAEQISIAVRNAELYAVANLARQEAERANSVKSQFLAAMSHELRTPLNGIINFTGFVADEMLGEINERQRQFLKDAILNAEHLLALINDILDISKIDAGSLKLFVESNINLNDEIETIARTGETLLKEKPVKLQLEIADNLPLMTGDKRRIRQIILNLVSNACKFTDEGSVTISASQATNGEILVAVKDTGPGIAAQDHEKVFETFLQTDAGLRKGGGTGLGLPISRRLAEAHGGRLWVDSALGEGAKFYVSLPVSTL